MADAIDRAKEALSERAELPGMSLMEHLEELRRRIVWTIVGVAVGFFAAYALREHIVGFLQQPIVTTLAKHHQDTRLTYLNPLEPFNFYMKVALVGGIILSSPWTLYQVWLFISPGLFKHEKRYLVPFMVATVGLFLLGAWFGYHYVYPNALEFFINRFNTQFRPMVTIGEYTNLFMTVILGLGVVFELPILVFFLALFGIVSAGFMVRHFRYAVLLIFVVAAIISPPDILSMCVYAAPMLALYVISIGIAYMVHPSRRKAREAKA